MRVRNAAMVLGAVLVGFAGQTAHAITSSVPISSTLSFPELTPKVDASFDTYTYTITTALSGDKIGNLSISGPFEAEIITNNPPVDLGDTPVFEVDATLDLTTQTVLSGHLDVQGDPTGGETEQPYFFSNTITGFAFDGTALLFTFTQEINPADPAFPGIGGSIGVTAPSISPVAAAVPGAGPFDLNTPSGGDVDLIKAFPDATPASVPEPLTTLLVGLSLGATGLRLMGRRRAV